MGLEIVSGKSPTLPKKAPPGMENEGTTTSHVALDGLGEGIAVAVFVEEAVREAVREAVLVADDVAAGGADAEFPRHGLP